MALAALACLIMPLSGACDGPRWACAGPAPIHAADAGPADVAPPPAASAPEAGAPADPTGGVKYAGAKAFVFNRDWRHKGFCMSILDEKGALCSSAEPPGVTLSRPQIEAALAAFAEPTPEPDMAPFCFEPHHGIVLYDEAGQPVFAMSVCFECERSLKWPLRPGPGFDTPALRRSALLRFEALLCGELGLKPCFD